MDTGWRTELNLSHAVPDDYNRTATTTVDEEAFLQSWLPSGDLSSVVEDAALLHYVGRGCSSSHGLDLKGGAVGDNLTETSASDIRTSLEKGPEGMPSYPFLSDAEVRDLIILVTGKEPPAQASRPPHVEPSLAPFEPTPTTPPTAEPTPTPLPDRAEATVAPVDTPAPAREVEEEGPVSIRAATATITVDGDISDWSEISVTTVKLQQIEPIPGEGMGELSPIGVDIRMAIDAEKVYLLLVVSDDFDYVPEDTVCRLPWR